MSLRRAHLAGSWYPRGRAACAGALARYSLEVTSPGRVVGGLAPHAGWAYSGATAARTFAVVGEPPPRAVVLLGISHRKPIRRAVLDADDAWSTPLGEVPVDREVADRILAEAGDLLTTGRRPHGAGENSIEVLVPFVKHFCPDAGIVPIAVASGSEAVDLGDAVGRGIRDVEGRILVLGSTDLTHYGNSWFGFAPHGSGEPGHRWSKEVNDRSFLDRVEALDAAGALADARKRQNACGAAAAAATIAASRILGADRGVVLEHTTSHEVEGATREPTDFVGYASVAFVVTPRG